MKTFPLLLIPAVSLFLSACAAGPGAVDGGPGYPGGGTVYVQGSGYDHRDYNDDQYTHNVTNVTDVNRTNVTDRTVNRTNVNQVDLKTKGKQSATQTAARKTTHKPVAKAQTEQQANQPAS